MATDNFISIAEGEYQYKGEVFPLSTFTNDLRILTLAGKLARQGRAMALAQLTEQNFYFKPIPIPSKLQHIFGG